MARRKNRMTDIARYMPPLRHTIPGDQFDIRKSEVMKWLMKSPIVWNYVWNNIKQSGAVVYNAETGTWQGADYNDQ